MNSIHKNLIRSCEIFKNISDDAFSYLIENGEICRFKKGSVIYSRENYRKSLGIMLEGRAVTQKTMFLLSTIEAGRVFGVAAIFSDNGFVAEITAAEKCVIFFADESLLSKVFGMDRTVAENFVRFLSGRIMFLNKKIDTLTSGNAESRIASFLIENISDTNGEIRMSFNLTKLSEFLNMGRASLYRVLSMFEKAGIIQKDGRKIYVKDVSELKKYI
jgi:CRP-like cAMP-binding protein